MKLFRFGAFLALAALARADTIAVNDPIFVAGGSPGNWVSGNGYVLATNPGAYRKFSFVGPSIGIKVDVSALINAGIAAKQYPRFKYRVDFGEYVVCQLAASDTTIALASNLGDATHMLEIHLLSTDAYVHRWDGTSSLKITSVELAEGKSLVAPTVYPPWVPLLFKRPTAIWMGDSIPEGAWSVGAPGDYTDYSNYCDATLSFARIISDWLGADYGMCCFGGSGYETWFNGDVPPLPLSFRYVMNGCPRDLWGVTYVFISLGTNGGAQPNTVTLTLESLRAACGDETKIYVIPPFNQNAVVNISLGVQAYQAAHPNDLCFLLNLGATGRDIVAQNSTDGAHPNQRGHELLADQLKSAISDPNYLSSGGVGPSIGWLTFGFLEAILAFYLILKPTP